MKTKRYWLGEMAYMDLTKKQKRKLDKVMKEENEAFEKENPNYCKDIVRTGTLRASYIGELKWE